MSPPARLLATVAAVDLLRRLVARNGSLMMHQSGGCCDGSSPMCFPDGEFLVGDRDVLVGVLDLRLGAGETLPDPPSGSDAVPVWISGSQFEVWKHTCLVLDMVPGRGAGFSLETTEGVRFLSRGGAFTDDENAELASSGVLLGRDWADGTRPAASQVPLVVSDAADACAVPQRSARETETGGGTAALAGESDPPASAW
ncbi:DUF779 domain-containing protein [Rhodococcus coprophilus]|uniref:Uncharacterized protein conserved in bacteria n=1 Tax=Rhodococcus coprophilus TaxID=38310 RepID=A0A2X4XLY4_9NOCA|nr:DUF779 domain-containing protein [Rhodococcus coprophilus]MBM7459899.1 uncharacterized protein (DUF779 family) [Rhodococcus coprophilus]SQI37654.1 Uncharacterized protein conserved in bacteria [Rhodococcus coprophilus]